MATRCRYMNAQQWICYLYSLIQEIEVSGECIWKGNYSTASDLKVDLPIGQKPWFVFVEETETFWYWSVTLNMWVNQDITANDYKRLNADDRACVPYIIVP